MSFKQISIVSCLAVLITLQSCVYNFDRHKIENWHKLRATGEAALVKHDYENARKCFEQAVEIAEPLKNEPVRLAISLEELSKVCLETKNKDLAVEIYNKALALANKRSQTPQRQLDILENELGECLINIGQVFVADKNYSQAAICFREARALFASVFKDRAPILTNYIMTSYLAWAVDGLGTSYKELGQIKEAKQAYFSLQEYNIINGLPEEIKRRLLSDFCTIPETSEKEKQKYADILGCVYEKSTI